jgi:hypothetical protein
MDLKARNAELEAKLANAIAWLEANQPDVFARGIWEAIRKKPEPRRQSHAETERGISDWFNSRDLQKSDPI